MAQGNAGTRDTRLEAVEARRTKPTLTSLVRFNATFPQKGLSRKDGPELSPERYISLCRSGRQTLTRQSRPSFATGPSQSGRAELLPDSRPRLCQWPRYRYIDAVDMFSIRMATRHHHPTSRVWLTLPMTSTTDCRTFRTSIDLRVVPFLASINDSSERESVHKVDRA